MGQTLKLRLLIVIS